MIFGHNKLTEISLAPFGKFQSLRFFFLGKVVKRQWLFFLCLKYPFWLRAIKESLFDSIQKYSAANWQIKEAIFSSLCFLIGFIFLGELFINQRNNFYNIPSAISNFDSIITRILDSL